MEAERAAWVVAGAPRPGNGHTSGIREGKHRDVISEHLIESLTARRIGGVVYALEAAGYSKVDLTAVVRRATRDGPLPAPRPAAASHTLSHVTVTAHTSSAPPLSPPKVVNCPPHLPPQVAPCIAAPAGALMTSLVQPIQHECRSRGG